MLDYFAHKKHVTIGNRLGVDCIISSLEHMQSSGKPEAHLAKGLRVELKAFEELVAVFINQSLPMRQKILSRPIQFKSCGLSFGCMMC